ncbi:hypothetical protein IFR05_001729 [Cadophora sp. M221]|nr:hypothetical protein IFR05_001729 [Cadophora sp. M221]
MEMILHFARKQARASNPKVRPGCMTCKNRRVKCDEVKPICGRCSRGDRQCEYFPPGPISRKRKPRPTQGPTIDQLHPRSVLPWAPAADFPGNDQEKRCFELFRDRIALDLGGTFEMPFFTILVLRECHTQIAIRHFVLALSGICRACGAQEAEKYEYEQFAMDQQNRALKALQKVLVQGTAQIRLAVIASALLCCYEGLQGNFETARQQLFSGSKLLQTWHATRGTVLNGAQVSPLIDDELLNVFPRLELGLAGYATINPVTPFSDQDEEPIETDTFPPIFISYVEARKSVVRMIDLCLRFMRKVGRQKRQQWPPVFPDTITQEAKKLSAAIQSWFAAFEPFKKKPGLLQHPGYLVFSVGIGFCKLSLTTGSSATETIHDEYLSEYQRFVHESRLMIEKGLAGKTYTKLQSIMEMTMPLCYTATRCRDRGVRLNCLQLLKDFPTRQSVFDHAVISRVLEWVMGVEEEGMDEKGYIPEESRIRLHTLQWMIESENLHIEAMQGGLDGDWVLRRDVLEVSR